MPLRIIHEDRRDKPAIFCDQCKQRILKLEDANYHWPDMINDGTYDRLPTAPIYFTHKDCCKSFRDDKLCLEYGAEVADLLVSLINAMAPNKTFAQLRREQLDRNPE